MLKEKQREEMVVKLKPAPGKDAPTKQPKQVREEVKIPKKTELEKKKKKLELVKRVEEALQEVNEEGQDVAMVRGLMKEFCQTITRKQTLIAKLNEVITTGKEQEMIFKNKRSELYQQLSELHAEELKSLEKYGRKTTKALQTLLDFDDAIQEDAVAVKEAMTRILNEETRDHRLEGEQARNFTATMDWERSQRKLQSEGKGQYRSAQSKYYEKYEGNGNKGEQGKDKGKGKSKSKTKDDEVLERPKKKVKYGYYSEKALIASSLEVGEAIIDLGCSKSLMHNYDMNRMVEKSREITGRTSTKKRSNVGFKTAQGRVNSTKNVQIPTTLSDESSVSVEFEVLPSTIGENLKDRCPPLFSVAALEKLQGTIDLSTAGRPTVYSRLLQKHLPIRKVNGLYVINLLEVNRMEKEKYNAETYEKMSVALAALELDRDALIKLHKSLGHVGTEKLVSILKGADASNNTISEATGISKACGTCNKVSPAPRHSKIAGVSAKTRGEVFAMDLIYPKVKPNTKVYCLSIIDVFSRFHKVYALEDRNGKLIEDITDKQIKTESVRRALIQARNELGIPQTILMDGDGLLNNEVALETFTAAGATIKFSSPEAPWQNGLCERHGAVFKRILKCFLLDNEGETAYIGRLTIKEIIQLIISMKNEQPGSGLSAWMSPFHVWFGRQPQSALTTKTESFLEIHPDFTDQLLDVRIATDRIEQIVRSKRYKGLIDTLLQKPRKKQKVYAPGDKIWFYSTSDRLKTKWRGPAIYLRSAQHTCTLEYQGRFYKRSTDCIKPYFSHSALVSTTNESNIKKFAEDLYYEYLNSGKFNKSKLEKYYGQKILMIKYKPDAKQFSMLRGISLSRIKKRITYGYRNDKLMYHYDHPKLDKSNRTFPCVSRDVVDRTPQITVFFGDETTSVHRDVSITAQQGTNAAGDSDDDGNDDDDNDNDNDDEDGDLNDSEVNLQGDEYDEATREEDKDDWFFSKENLGESTTVVEPHMGSTITNPNTKRYSINTPTKKQTKFSSYGPARAPPREEVKKEPESTTNSEEEKRTETAEEELRMMITEIENWVMITMKDLKPKEIDPQFTYGKEWDDARKKEIDSFIKYNVFDRIMEWECPTNKKPIPCRWVYTRKDDGTAKARLTSRGDLEKRRYERMGEQKLQTDSPTAMRYSLRIFLQVCAQLEFIIESADVPTAFLQQDKEFIKERDTPVLRPPYGCEEKEGTLWSCKKVIYGHGDAPRLWFLSLKKYLQSLGFVAIAEDTCVYVYRFEGKIIGQLLVHVDDVLYAGVDGFNEWIFTALQDKYGVKTRQAGEIKFCGVWIEQDIENKLIYVDQHPYIGLLEETKIDAQKGLEEKLNAQEIQEVQSLAGAINWLSGQSRPDLSWSVSHIVGDLSATGNINVLKDANKMIRQAKHDKMSRMIFKKLPGSLQDLKLIAYSDASWANMPNLKSQSGQMFMIGTKAEQYVDNFPATLVHWKSARIKRVCRSTFAAETLSMTDCADTAIMLRRFIEHWLDQKIDLECYTDCKSLAETLKMLQPEASEKRLKLDLLGLRENLENKVITRMLWIPTQCQIADALTKRMRGDVILSGMYNNTWPYSQESLKNQKLQVTQEQRTLLMMLHHIHDDDEDYYG